MDESDLDRAQMERTVDAPPPTTGRNYVTTSKVAAPNNGVTSFQVLSLSSCEIDTKISLQCIKPTKPVCLTDITCAFRKKIVFKWGIWLKLRGIVSFIVYTLGWSLSEIDRLLYGELLLTQFCWCFCLLRSQIMTTVYFRIGFVIGRDVICIGKLLYSDVCNRRMVGEPILWVDQICCAVRIAWNSTVAPTEKVGHALVSFRLMLWTQ